MAYLFIDSTYDLTLGLLNDEFSWTKYDHFPDQKASEILQMKTLELCNEQNINVTDLKGVIHVAGPGFYTGLRLSEGFVDVLKFSGIPVFSFYTYDIFQYFGKADGHWLTKAYRGEYFIHDIAKNENHLVSSKEFPEFIANKKNFYIHSDKAIDDLIRSNISEMTSTYSLILNHPEIISQLIKNNSQKESFYFRAPEDEFRTSK